MFLAKPNTPEGSAGYTFLEEVGSLDDFSVWQTLQSYLLGAEEYSAIEYSPETIVAATKHVIRPISEFLGTLPKDARIAVPATGSGRDPILLALLRKEVQVYAYDVTSSLLAISRRLLWPTLSADKRHRQNAEMNTKPISDIIETAIFAQLKHGGPFPHEGWVQFFNQNFEQARIALNGEDSQQIMSDSIRGLMYNIVSDLQRRIHLIEGRFQDTFFAPESFDLMLVVAAYQHLPDDDFFRNLDQSMAQLRPGGQMYFNVRHDALPDQTERIARGHIFMDQVLSHKNLTTGQQLHLPRYYRTFSITELQQIKTFLENKYNCIVENLGTSNHPDLHKPSFSNFLIKKY